MLIIKNKSYLYLFTGFVIPLVLFMSNIAMVVFFIVIYAVVREKVKRPEAEQR